MVVVTVVGLLQDPAFHAAKCTAEALKLKFPHKFADPVIQPLVEVAWHEYLQKKKRELRGEVWAYTSSVMCFMDGQLLGDEKELLSWSSHEWNYQDTKPSTLHQAAAGEFYTNYLKQSQHVFVYLEIAIEEQPIGRLLFELFSDVCPRTCENFRALCAGGAKSPRDGRELTYKDSVFHRLLKSWWIQGGDIVTGKGGGGESIFGPTFEDESFAISHKGRGVLGMANQGRHSNSSQFYITFQPAPYLDRRYVAFGQLIEGTEVLQKLEDVPTCNERPTVACRIVQCGTFEP
ncbi:probable inactive peptidyl-prolyl cis-trans isomerase-like 6 [Indicator indicator]|uniref:probable inactive peptidyl-prolyl cis-trans isomerase-like 6 n=1 Tax=Indicator indicator TaxID=1002788 RepID=UPI0023DF2EE6|nr:probable inactive peptidyl-prolyl cis-trans isomerase-like 6 [Indicator indicator]